MDLCNSYLGEHAWELFVRSLCLADANLNGLSNLGVPSDIEKVLIYKVGPIEHTKRWLFSPVPALSYYKPIDIIRNYKEGEVILRTVLMRMP